ncbi:MAG TPA: pseudouridine synthase [Burkholderiales bacterium]
MSRSRPPKPAPVPPTPNPKQPPVPEAEKRAERLQKLLAAAGLGSRRTIESWIEAGRVTVGGRVAKLGDRALPGDEVAVDGRPVSLGLKAAGRVLIYNKPEGELVTRSDPQGRPTVFARLPPGRWVAVGRLDLNSAGLLLFTDDGELANRLMHPRYEIEREYAVRAQGPVDMERLRRGVALDDGQAAFDRIEPTDPRAAPGSNRWYRVMLKEGRNREVRRMFEAVGARVSRLLRVRYGSVELPRDLKPGEWRELAPEQLRELFVK